MKAIIDRKKPTKQAPLKEPPPTKRAQGVLVMLFPEEKKLLFEAARKEGMGLSTFLRTLGLRRASEAV